MSGIKNSKKNDAGNLLPQRRPRLGKYIALAVMLHVAFGIVYLYVTQKEPKKQSEGKTPPVRVVPLSPQNKELRRNQDESPSVPSFRSASRPMTPPKLMSPVNRGTSISPRDRFDSPPMDRSIYSTKPNLIPIPASRRDFFNKRADREIKAWPDKQMAHRNMHVALLSESDFTEPSPKKPSQLSEPLPISGSKKSTDMQQPFQSLVKYRQDTAVMDPVRSPAMRPEVYLPEKKQSLPIRRQKRPVQLEQTLPSRHRMTLTDKRKPEAQLLARHPVKPVTFKSISPQKRNVSLPPKTHTVAPGKPVLKNLGVQMIDTSPAGPESADGAAAQKRMNPADVQKLALRTEPRPVPPPQHRPFSQPQTRLIFADEIPQPIVFSKGSNGSQRDWKGEKKPPTATPLLFPEGLTEDFQAKKPLRSFQPGRPTLKNFVVQLLTASLTGPERIGDAATQKRVNPTDFQGLALRAEIKSVAPLQHRPFSQPQTRLVYADEILQPIIFSKRSEGSPQGWKGEKKPPTATSLLFPEELTADLRAKESSRLLQPGKLPEISQKANLSHENTIGAVRIETIEKATFLRPETVWQKEPEVSPHLSNYAPLQPELPPLIEDHLAEMVKRLIQPTLQRYSASRIRILAKNLTYRDLGLESEGTKFLSGLLKAEIEKQDGVELFTPADVSRNPQVVIEGEMWDDPEKINVHIWSLDHESGHRMHTADLSFRRKMVPNTVKIQPPSGKNLNLIQRMVELMKQNFPRGGDFQLGVWPNKGLDAIYIEGESLMVSILPEKNAYLHVDYYQIDGKVVHLLPSQHESNYIKAGEPYVIGDPKSGGYEFKVSDPFGEELLVVVASQHPLGAIAHSLIEPAEPYIKRLADSLRRQRKKTLMAGSHYIVLTKKRN